jgi:cyclopropane fatty-acyl-phospholipid synthase-like methyltransferase
MERPSTLRQRLRRGGAYALGVTADLTANASHKLRDADGGASLQGDRWVEWSFCFARMTDGPGRTLDFGADIGFLSLAAAQRGHEVTALDRLASALDYDHPAVRHVQADVLTHDFGDERFDQILNCSSVEHVGLGGRYGSFEDEDGDLKAMNALRAVLADGGRHVLTIPVGRDQVAAPQHRIYGERRLPRLLEHHEVAEEQFWHKHDGLWRRCDRATALATEGSASFYSLGLFVLTG